MGVLFKRSGSSVAEDKVPAGSNIRGAGAAFHGWRIHCWEGLHSTRVQMSTGNSKNVVLFPAVWLTTDTPECDDRIAMHLPGRILLVPAGFLIACAFAFHLNSFAADTVPEQGVTVGAAMEDVLRILGEPRGKARNGGAIFWLYDGGDVEFRDGKVVSARVASVQKKIPTTPSPAAVAQPVPAPPQPVSAVQSNALPDDVPALVQRHADSSGHTGFIYGSLSRANVGSAKEREYAAKGVIPYRITASVYRIKPSGGASTQIRSGNIRVRLFDENGQVTVDREVSAAAMCPT